MDKETGESGQRVGLDIGREVIYQPMQHLPRQLGHLLSARTIGFEPEQRSWIDKHFDWIGFCFIIAGAGFCERDGERWRIQGPCVLIQRPGHHYRHGPDREWEQFYVTYDAECMAYFSAPAWRELATPFMALDDAELLRRRCKQIFAVVPELGTFGAADRIDQLFAQLLLEVLIAARRPVDRQLEARLQEARGWLEGHYTEDFDAESLARRHGFASRTFRRYWRQRFGSTPVEYVTGLRLRRAGELLLAGRLPIAEIAALVGYDDPFYFTRRFRQVMGETPSAYRRAHIG